MKVKQNNNKNKILTMFLSISKFEENAFKVKVCRMLIDSYYWKWWEEGAEKEKQPDFYHHI